MNIQGFRETLEGGRVELGEGFSLPVKGKLTCPGAMTVGRSGVTVGPRSL
jgi:hypothetical protein